MTVPRQAQAGALWIEPASEDATDVLTPLIIVQDVDGNFTVIVPGPTDTPAAELRDWGAGYVEPVRFTHATIAVDGDGDYVADPSGIMPGTHGLYRNTLTGDFDVAPLGVFPPDAYLVPDATTGDQVLLPTNAPSATFLRNAAGDIILH